MSRSPRAPWFWQAYPVSSPQDEATTDLVNRLRNTELPGQPASTSRSGGSSAASIDFADYLAGRLPLLIGAVLILSFLLLMVVFRSLLVPLKAVVMNLLSIGAAYGIIVAIFQWGWAKNLFGIGKEGPIDAWIPMMLFAIVFGLSMDYEVFLLSRMKEEYDRTGDNADGGRRRSGGHRPGHHRRGADHGLRVLGASCSATIAALKLFGLGLASAVLVDATIVRMVLVPATMELLGDRNWWLPKWLDRVLPTINVEGFHADEQEREPSSSDSAGGRALTRTPAIT